ncbi:type IV toxin-antitoxin system AbiEi family antitoxin domain-containing protein [Pseudofrankia sp. DC12]|uniref:type IV toxin-antitoxin system AbiEi family antitoxin domain-containing protein n=1 Tax=Pseudofrankia sp. DC12 TaxID=683315 RepID=UPI0018DE35DF|nr:type IV toxin-antitoxin system AbiEi family antitoxin domain-containing protein [Pseudofrankia sp. DC12]
MSGGTGSPRDAGLLGGGGAGLSSLGGLAVVPPAGPPVPAARDGQRAAAAGAQQPAWLAPQRDGVLTMKEAVAAGFSRTEIRRRVDAGLWQLYSGDVLVTQAGPLTLIQRLWCALVSIGPDALLGGASAAALGGLRGCGEPWLTVILASGRRVTPRPGVKLRATARLGEEDLHRDGWPPRTTLPRSLVDMAEWAPSHDDARTLLALAVASGIVESDEIRAALARRGPIARRQIIGDVLDDLDAGAPWVPDLLYRRLEARHGLPPALRGRPDSRLPGRLDLLYEAWQVRVEIGAVSAPGIRTATEAPAPAAGPVSARGPGGLAPAAGPWSLAADSRGFDRRNRLVLRVPRHLLMEEPDRVGTAIATTLRQRGWPGVPRAARGPGALPFGQAFGPALDQAFGPAVGLALGGPAFGGGPGLFGGPNVAGGAVASGLPDQCPPHRATDHEIDLDVD